MFRDLAVDLRSLPASAARSREPSVRQTFRVTFRGRLRDGEHLGIHADVFGRDGRPLGRIDATYCVARPAPNLSIGCADGGVYEKATGDLEGDIRSLPREAPIGGTVAYAFYVADHGAHPEAWRVFARGARRITAGAVIEAHYDAATQRGGVGDGARSPARQVRP